MHLGPKVPRVYRDDADPGIPQLIRERLRDEFERRLAGPIPAPSGIAAAGRVARDVHDETPRRSQQRKTSADEGDRREHIDLKYPPQRGERMLQERRERRPPQLARSLAQQTQPTRATDR